MMASSSRADLTADVVVIGGGPGLQIPEEAPMLTSGAALEGVGALIGSSDCEEVGNRSLSLVDMVPY